MQSKTSLPIHVCHLSSVHVATDTRILYRYCFSLQKKYSVTLIAVHNKKEILNGIQIIPFKRYKNKILRVLFTWIIMFFKAYKVKASLYHFHDPELIPCGLLLKWTGKKVLFDVHENIAEDIFDKDWIRFKGLLYFFYSYFEKLAIHNFNLILAEKSYEKRFLSKSARFTTVYNYPVHTFFEPFYIENRKKNNRIFYIGILLESRAILQIAEALYLLQKKNIFVYFDVVGELYSELNAKIHALPFYPEIKNYLIFHGRKNLENGYAISKNAQIGMSLIHPMSNSIHSYPTKMFEYLCIGLPQIVSHFPLYESVVLKNKSGLSCNPLNAHEIAEKIAFLMNNESEYEMMAANAKLASKQYDWKSEELKIFSVYQQLLTS